jgi:hypothetical protein
MTDATFGTRTMIEIANSLLKGSEINVTLFSVVDSSIPSGRVVKIYALLSSVQDGKLSQPSVRLFMGRGETKRDEDMHIGLGTTGIGEGVYGLCCFLIASGMEISVTNRSKESKFQSEILNIHVPKNVQVFDIEEAFYALTDAYVIGKG